MKRNPFERLPESVDIDGKSVPIDSDFRVGVAIETELLTDEPDVEGLLRAFYPDGIPFDVETAADRMLEFYSHMDGADSEDKEQKHSSARYYDFSQDADALTASFRQAYGIDLEQDTVHWWKFRRLMFGLPPECQFMQRVHYRTADIEKLPKEQRKHYRKMKRLFAIKQPERRKMTAEEHEQAMKERVRRRFEEAKARKEV